MTYATSSVLHGTRGVPVKVLIADDHPVVRQGLKLMLNADQEIDVVGEARDGDEAFEMAHAIDWDVAVFDPGSRTEFHSRAKKYAEASCNGTAGNT